VTDRAATMGTTLLLEYLARVAAESRLARIRSAAEALLEHTGDGATGYRVDSLGPLLGTLREALDES
jgi:hypothetical protein